MAKDLKASQDAPELLKDILIVLLAQNKASQVKIREIVGVDMNRISWIVKSLNINQNDQNK